MLNKNIICTESPDNSFEVNEIYEVKEIQEEFCIKSPSNGFYKVTEIRYPNIKAESLLFGDEVSFKFQDKDLL